jgi:hypothetical protein
MMRENKALWLLVIDMTALFNEIKGPSTSVADQDEKIGALLDRVNALAVAGMEEARRDERR